MTSGAHICFHISTLTYERMIHEKTKKKQDDQKETKSKKKLEKLQNIREK